jgi:penicillin V acylase-like amidase (Ntn superfamily)
MKQKFISLCQISTQVITPAMKPREAFDKLAAFLLKDCMKLESLRSTKFEGDVCVIEATVTSSEVHPFHFSLTTKDGQLNVKSLAF